MGSYGSLPRSGAESVGLCRPCHADCAQVIDNLDEMILQKRMVAFLVIKTTRHVTKMLPSVTVLGDRTALLVLLGFFFWYLLDSHTYSVVSWTSVLTLILLLDLLDSYCH